MNWIQRKIFQCYVKIAYRVMSRWLLPSMPPAFKKLLADDCVGRPHIIPYEAFKPGACPACGHARAEHTGQGGCRVVFKNTHRSCFCEWDGETEY